LSILPEDSPEAEIQAFLV